ncbi:MAG TPA: glutathione transferase GstA [Rhodocyclaceae bacterium]|nr:MAG: glutathione transferase GstA [Rhodocyclales bacterium CG_4_9_14_3_um_filter_68_10]HCX33787.1 glutathione transferase GstA [Rhodocyclaceae bacterium]
MKLYYSPGACSLSPHIVACEAGIALERVKVDLKTKRTESGEDFRAVNPNGYVPVLVLDDGAILTEGPAIVQWLADRVPDKALAPAWGSLARYRLIEWLNHISTEVHKGFSPLFDPRTPDAWKAIVGDRLAERLGNLEKRLGAGPWLMGETFTVADPYLFTVLSWGKWVDVDLARWPGLAAYHARVAARPAVQHALREEGLA